MGACLVWREGEPTIQAAGGLYGRIYDPTIKRTDYAHRVVWRRVYGPIPRGLEVDHLCEITLCQRPDHLDLVTRSENTRRRHPKPGPIDRKGPARNVQLLGPGLRKTQL